MTIEKHTKTKIKICGLRRREDILAVNEAKPDYCGFIVEYPKSRRSIDRTTLRELVRGLREEIVPVGVFVNAPKELVAELLEEGTIQIAQLHGQESQEYTGIKGTDRKTADSGIFHKVEGRCGAGPGECGGLYFTGSGKRRNGKSV